MNETLAAVCADDTFGPGVASPECRGGFDFTLLFEESILAIVPAACFLFIAPFRARGLLRRRFLVRRNLLHRAKLLTVAAYAALQLALLVLAARTGPFGAQTRASVASAALCLVSGLLLLPLSHLEHAKSARPSYLINLYLLLTALFDVARVRTLWLLGTDTAIAGALSASLAVKCVLLVLEAIEKRALLLDMARLSLESTSGPFSRGTFWWLNALLMSGSKRILTSEGLPAIHEKLDSGRLADEFQAAWNNCNQKRKHALALACTWNLRLEILAVALPKFLNVGLALSQTYLVNTTILWLQGSQSANTGYGLIGATAFVYIGSSVTAGWHRHLTYRIMSMMRGGLIGIIYNKMTSLNMADASESSALTLMGTDVSRIAETFHFLLIDAIPAVVQLAVAMYLLYLQIGAICVAPIIVTIIATALSAQLAGMITSRQKAWLQAVEKRISYTSEILGSMRNIKMLGFTEKMAENVQALRDDELAMAQRYRTVQSLNIGLVNSPQYFNSFLIFAIYAISAQLKGTDGINVSQAITALAAIELISSPLGTLLIAIPTGWSALGCFARIQTFLEKDSRTDFRISPQDTESPASMPPGDLEMANLRPSKPATEIRVQNADFGWSNATPTVVKDVSLTIKDKSFLSILVGPVGCGKTTFLKGLLGETATTSGSVYSSSLEIAYCPQTPWLMNGSVRENIVANSEVDEVWYNSVLQACALHIDIANMPDGDATVVGSKGVKLSGGQKQRLSLARAIYSRKPLAVLDDILSGLDSTTEDHVFKHVFGPSGLFKQIGTTVMLATHSVKHLPQADLVVALDETGKMVEKGSFADLNVPGSYIHSLRITLNKESSNAEHAISSEAPEKHDKAVAVVEDEDDESRKTGNWRLYLYYLRALGGKKMVIFLSLVATDQAMYAVGSVWVNLWATSNETGEHGARLGYWLGIYALLTSLTVMSLYGAIAWMWTVIVPKSGAKLHSSMLSAAMSAPLSFYSKTETGVLANRFSQDLRLADLTLPGAIINMAFQLGGCLVTIALATTAVSYFAALIPAVATVLYFVQRFYLRTSRQLRLLEIEAAAPIFSHFIETTSGLLSIRSFGWVADYIAKSQKILDVSQKPYYLLLCIQRWLELVLDLVVAALAIALVGLAVALRSTLSPGFLGLALVQMMSLSHSLTNLVQFWTTLETSLGAIARIQDFAENTPTEKLPENEYHPDAEWPSQGSLEFDHVSATYDVEQGAPVLQDLSFAIASGQKLGIVGRTGSGKSSSTLALLRLIDVITGKIVLDGIDLSSVRGSLVRERLICLTQDPFLFPGTLRENADPLGESADDSIRSAMQKVGLWDLLHKKAGEKATSPADVLDTVMDVEFLSHGQRQLFCLARATLQSGTVLILDEPTSSVDTQTDAKMQEVIRAHFKRHTIIMIAHRLDSILDFDQVAVLNAGRLIELGKPSELLKGNGHFAKMYRGTKEE